MNKRYIPLLIVLLCLGMFSINAFGQKRQKKEKITMVTVESVIKDAEGTPIPDVLISGREGATEAVSDASGHFKISVPEKSILLFESDGFESKSISLEESIPTSVTLSRTVFQMGDADLVNIAFGKVHKREIVGAVSVVDPKKLKKTDDTEVFYDALNGKVPGLLGNNNIRGLGTALIIVDGIPRDPSSLNLSEIDQITILKDGNAAMLWGSQAKNGVILVTTKRGTAYKRKIDVSVERGFSTPVALPKYLGSAEYFKLYNEASRNDGLDAPFSDQTIALYADGRNPYRYPSVDYYSSEYLKNSRPTSRILTEFSGGNENTRYYANVGWNRTGTLYQLGEGAKATANRFNMRVNVDFKVNDYIKSSVDAVIIFDLNKNPNGNFWSDASRLHPDYFSPLLPVSMISRSSDLQSQLATAKYVNGNYLLGGTEQYRSNPYGNMIMSGYLENNQRTASINNSVEADLRNVTQGLKFKTYLSFDVFNRYDVQVSNKYAVYDPTWQTFGSNDSIVGLSMIGTDESSGVQNMPVSSMYFQRRIGAYAMFDYDRTFNDIHHVSATLLGYWDKFHIDAVTIDQKDAHLGLRIAYDYRKKFLADFSNTYTNGFRLMPGKMGGYAPSLALAWIISNEDFMKESNSINYLKLRGSASIQNIDLNGLGTEWRPYKEAFDFNEFYNYADGFRQTRSVVINRAPNTGLKFEKMKSINLGLEGYFFNRLLNVDLNVFTQRWSGQATRQTSLYPVFIGNYYPWENYNETGYTGGELGVTLAKSMGKVYFELGANLLYATSKEIKRSESWGFDYLNRQGKSSDAIFGLESLGLFKDEADVKSSPVQRFSQAQAGDIKYKDQNGDNVIDANDQVQIGHSQAKYSYGLNFLAKLGNLSLMATGDGRRDYQYTQGDSYFWVQGNAKYSVEVLNRWTPATAATATYPRLSSQASTNNFQTSTFWLQNGNYFRLNRVQLTFDIPQSILQNKVAKEISIYLRGSNLVMWTANQNNRQLNIGAEPNYRSYALGVNILF